MRKTFVCSAVAGYLIAGFTIAQTDVQPNTESSSSKYDCLNYDHNVGKQAFTDGSNAFTANFYAELSKVKNGVSTITSPYSLLLLLAQLYLFSSGKTYEQLGAALGVNSKGLAYCFFPALVDEINSEKDVEFTLATKTYASKYYPLSEQFKNVTRDIFQAEAETLNFADSAGSAFTINKWVEKKTQNKIKDILSPDALSEGTVAVLVNALYFKGAWQQPFHKDDTNEENFYTLNGDIKKVKLMYKEDAHFLYGDSQDLKCKILSMPYGKKGEFAFWIFLPNTVDGLPELQETMKDIKLVENAVKNTSNVTINVYIPRMKIETTISLVDLLKKLNITGMFNPVNPGLENIFADREHKFSVTDGIQKAIIEVTEEGTVAAAANVLLNRLASFKPRPLVYQADRSFVYQIRHKSTVIFTGSYLGD